LKNGLGAHDDDDDDGGAGRDDGGSIGTRGLLGAAFLLLST
jgi:hypothetical protein